MPKTKQTKLTKLFDTVEGDNRPQYNFAKRGDLPTTEISATLFDLALVIDRYDELYDITNGSYGADHPFGYGIDALIEAAGYEFHQVKTVTLEYLEKLIDNPPSRKGVSVVFNYAPIGVKGYRAEPAEDLRKIAALYGMAQTASAKTKKSVLRDAEAAWAKMALKAGYNFTQVLGAFDFMEHEKRFGPKTSGAAAA